MRSLRTVHLLAPHAVWRRLLSGDNRPSLMTYAAVLKWTEPSGKCGVARVAKETCRYGRTVIRASDFVLEVRKSPQCDFPISALNVCETLRDGGHVVLPLTFDFEGGACSGSSPNASAQYISASFRHWRLCRGDFATAARRANFFALAR